MPTSNQESPPDDDLLSDPLLRDVPVVEGFKVLEPVVLYARLGAGGMGAVYRGRHYKLDLDVAVKCLKPQLAAADPDFVRRFEREARLAASIGHQNVVRVHDVHQKYGMHYLVMEFVRGESAADRVRRKGRLSQQEAIAILLGATAGLAEAHARGIVHRDIKPDNVLISLDGRVKLADLGLAKASDGVDGRSLSVIESRIMGTPQYMPPEQWETTAVTPAADIWALGASFYFLCTGQAGIAANGTYHTIARRIVEQDYPNLRTLRPDLPAAVHAMFERCVQRDPAQRFADARELLVVLRQLTTDEEGVLVDSAMRAGKSTPDATVAPPRQTLQRIRAQVETVASPGDASSRETVPSARPHPRPVPPPPRRVVFLAAAVVSVLAVGWFAFGALAGSTPGSSPGETKDKPAPAAAADARERARKALERGNAALSLPGQLDVAIVALEEAVALDRSVAGAVEALASALAGKARQLVETDLDAAFVASSRAMTLAPSVSGGQEQLAELRRRLEMRLAAGVVITDPAEGQLLDTRKLIVRGRADCPGPLTIRCAVVPTLPASTAFPTPGREAVLTGANWSGACTAEKDGMHEVWIEAEDRHGVRVTLAPPRRVVVDTELPTVQIEAPGPGLVRGKELEVRGTWLDVTECDITVNLAKATVDGKGWSAKLMLEDGPQEIVVEATDKAGLRNVAKRAILVDGTPPTISLGDVPSSFSEPLVTITGSVSDLQDGFLRVDGKLQETAANGRFAAVISVDAGSERDVLIEASDGAGNPATKTVRLRRGAAASGVASAGDTTLPPKNRPLRDVGSWATVMTASPDPTVVPDPSVRSRIEATGWPWRVRDTKTGIVLLLVPTGTFTMGSPDDEPGRYAPDERQHARTIRTPFYLGETEVTQAVWGSIMGGHLSHANGPDLPVEMVSFEKVESFLQRTGLALPTEAQWEYAARAGTSSQFSFGSELGPTQANFGSKGTLRAGDTAPNGWGFRDMHGNVWEWCQDTKNAYPATAQDERAVIGGQMRALRGGSWLTKEASCRSASRDFRPPLHVDKTVGFRVAKPLEN